MTTMMLRNDRDWLLESLHDARFELDELIPVTTDAARLDEIEAEIDTITGQIRRIRRKQIKELTAAMLADPQVQADIDEIRKGTADVRKMVEKIDTVTDRLKSVQKLVKRAIGPIDKLVEFLL